VANVDGALKETFVAVFGLTPEEGMPFDP